MLKKIVRPIDQKLLIVVFAFYIIILITIVMGGYFLRHSGDDFSLSVYVTDGMYNYFYTYLTTLNGRFSNGLIIYLIYQSPDIFIRLTPTLFISLFIVGIYLFNKQLVNHVKKWLLICLSVIFTVSLTMMPANQYQAFYWLPSFISYGLPLGLLLILYSYIFTKLKHSYSLLSLLILFMGAVFIGGLHEQIAILGAMIAFNILVILIINAIILGKINEYISIFKKQVAILLTVFTGFVSAFTINYLMPVTSVRRSASSGLDESTATMVQTSLRFSLDFLGKTLLRPTVIFFVFITMLVSFIIYKNYENKKTKALIAKVHPFTIYLIFSCLLIIPFLTLFIASLMARYGYGTPPPERALLPFYFILLLGFSLIGKLLSALCCLLPKRTLISSRTYVLIIVVLMLPVIIYTYTQKTTSIFIDVKLHAQEYNQREEYIQTSLKNKQKNVYIPSIPIGDTPYPITDEYSWVNKSIAEYYHLDFVKAYGY